MPFVIRPMIEGIKRTVVTKHAPTPVTSSIPKPTQPRYEAVMREPKPTIVVKDVSRTALPVLLKTIGVFLKPSNM